MDENAPPSQNHPELRKDETFLKNCYNGEPDEFDQIDFQTKRAGCNAYSESGRFLQHHFPVFVSTTEYDRLKREVKVGQ